MTAQASPDSPAPAGSPFDAFRHRAFTVMWIATVVSNIGMWIQSTAAGWLMTSLNPDPRTVAMVQVVTSLPLFLLGLPAGALADIYDKRRLLLAMEILGIALTLVLALLISIHHVSVFSMLLLIFLAGVAYALDAPAWQAIVPQLVGHKDLAPAVALNSVGINISRAIGPALAGLTLGWWGMSAPFWINGISNVGVVAALFWWREKDAQAPRDLPPERFGNAIRTGLRHARYNPLLRATLLRTTGFLMFATAYWALLPLVAKDRLGGGPELYGLLLGAIGIGAIGGAFVMPRIKNRLGADSFVVAGTLGTAVTLVLFGLARQPAVAFLASLLAGLCWISVLATLNVSAQVALPRWVRGRGLATYSTVMFGAMTFGSMLWGEIASLTDLPFAHCLAAAGAVIAIPVLRRWKLESGKVIDLTPSMHWPEPVLSSDVDDDRGPVLVTIEYRIAPADRDAFLAAIQHLAAGRKRDGAYFWGVFEDVEVSGRWMETFLVDSWLEHRRQHGRVTRSDQAMAEAVARFQVEGSPKVTHFIGVESGPLA